MAASEFPVLYYDCPHRVIKNILLLQTFAPAKKIILGRELTKMFEEIVRGNAEEIEAYFSQNPTKMKGEFSVIVF